MRRRPKLRRATQTSPAEGRPREEFEPGCCFCCNVARFYRRASKNRPPSQPGRLSSASLISLHIAGQQFRTTPSPPPSVISAPADVLSFTLEQAIVAILTTQDPAPQPATHQPAPASPAPPASNAAVLPAPRLPTSPLASPSLLPTYEEVEASTPVVLQRPVRLPQPARIVETPLWKIACRTRVDTM